MMTRGYEPTQPTPDSVLGYLQEILLIAVMLGERLPGARRPLQLLSRGGSLRELPSRIVQSNLAQSLRLDQLPQKLDVLSCDQLTLEEYLFIDEEVGFLAFRPAVWRDDRIELSMVVGGMNRDKGDWRCREIGHVDAAFHQINGRWTAIGEPHIYLAPDH